MLGVRLSETHNTNLFVAALGNGLEQLVGSLGLEARHDAGGVDDEGFAANQHHNIYGFLKEGYFTVPVLENSTCKSIARRHNRSSRSLILNSNDQVL